MKRRTSLLTRIASVWHIVCLAVLFTLGAQSVQAQGYRVQPGDTLRIEVLEDTSLNRSVLVAPDGRISVPQAGTLSVRGLSVEAIQNNLIQRLSASFASPPNVFVSIEQLAQRRDFTPAPPAVITIYVMGEVGRPGKLEVEPGTSVLQMFAVMGGFTKFAATKRIQLRRDASVYRLNYDQIEAGGQGGQTALKDGDVIVVPQRRLFE